MPAVMQWMKDRFAALVVRGEKGAAAVEYGLLVALIAVAIIAAVITLGGKVACTFSNTAGAYPNGAGVTTAAQPGC
jgi:pilus assembly protein Flp/PilA